MPTHKPKINMGSGKAIHYKKYACDLGEIPYPALLGTEHCRKMLGFAQDCGLQANTFFWV